MEDTGASLLSTLDILAVVAYFIIVLSVGIWSMMRTNRGTVSGFFLAGRYMFWLPVGASLFASNIGSEHFIGLSGSGAANGLGVGAFELNPLILLQVLGFIFLPVYIASKVCTLPEYMKRRFGGDRIRMYLTFLSLVLYIFTKISVNLYSGAIFIQQALQWSIYVSIFALLALTAVCTIGGGLAAVIYIDMFQVSVMIIGSGILLFRGLGQVGGWTELQNKYMTAIPNVTLTNPNDNSTCGVPGYDAWVLLRSPDSSEIPWPGFIFGQTPASIWYWCADQIMVQKALSAKSLSDAQGATILTGWMKILPMFLIVVPGMISRVLYPDEVGCVDPEICMNVCQNPVSCSNIAYPRLVLGIMPEGLRGIMISVMLAALMSDLTSIFNSASTLFTMDVYRRFRSNARSRELLLVGRICILILVGISILWIPLIQKMQGGQLYIYIQAIASYLSPPIAAVFCLAIVWKRMNESGAFWGLMIGLVIGLIRMILDFSFPAPMCMEVDDRPFIIAKVHYMYFAALLFWISILASVVISLLTPPGEDFRTVRTTIWTKRSTKQRPDDHDTWEAAEGSRLANDSQELEPMRSPDNNGAQSCDTEHIVQRSPVSLHWRFIRWFCALDDDPLEKAGSSSALEQFDVTTALAQTTTQKVILYLNLILIFGVAIAMYTYFSINPFTTEEINLLRQEAEALNG